MRGFYNKGMLPTVFFWKTSYGEEVDFIVEKQGKFIPIEVKLSSHIREEMAKGLISLRESIEVVPFSDFVNKKVF